MSSAWLCCVALDVRNPLSQRHPKDCWEMACPLLEESQMLTKPAFLLKGIPFCTPCALQDWTCINTFIPKSSWLSSFFYRNEQQVECVWVVWWFTHFQAKQCKCTEWSYWDFAMMHMQALVLGKGRIGRRRGTASCLFSTLPCSFPSSLQIYLVCDMECSFMGCF